ncbi:hypothetical protein BH10CYA1_BH10CYA1_65100 [soil metagenome]
MSPCTKILKFAIHSRVSCCSVAIALIANCVLLFCDPFKSIEPHKLPHPHTWAWWAVQDFLNESKPPQVVLVGSSLMMNPVWSNEAQYLNRDVDIAANRRIQYLGAAIQNRLPGQSTSCFNLALPGAMLSDDYMLIRGLLADKRKPEIVVLGLSPRDFIDNGFKCAAFSEHYRYLSKFVNTTGLAKLAMPHAWQRIAFYANQIIYLHGKKCDLQYLASEAIKSIASQVFGQQLPLAERKPKSGAQSRLAIYESEIEQGVWIAHPHCLDFYHETEYEKLKTRYKSANVDGCENQHKWFEMCLETCKKNGIEVIVVNMPLTETNIDLFAPGVYQNCVNLMAFESRKYNFSFIDLQNTHAFVRSDFTDMCHMDASGGKKLLDFIAGEIVGKSSPVASRVPSNLKIANIGVTQ